MSKVICIAGESGSGKTTSMRNLDPKSTYYIDADKKGLSWKGWRKQYNKENKNYLACDDANVVRQYIKRIAEACPSVKVIVVDTINGLMVADEMRRSKEKGYDKWVDLAACVWDLVCEAYAYREDLTIIFTAHTQTDHDEAGYMFTRIKTSGKKLDKICLESKFTTVLLSKCVDGAYKFETQANNSTAKSPMGAFDQMEIDNDIVEVMEACIDGKLDQVDLQFEDNAAVCVVLASDGYPVKYEKEVPMYGFENFKDKEGYYCFHAGTKQKDGQIVTNGGRVLGITATGKDLKEARKNAYAATEWISFANKYMRHDIGKAIDEA